MRSSGVVVVLQFIPRRLSPHSAHVNTMTSFSNESLTLSPNAVQPPPGSDTGVAHGCDEAWPHHVLCPSLPNRKVKRRPANLSRRNKCDERNMNEFIQKLPTPGRFPVPGLSPVAPQFVPIIYEQPSLPNDPGLLTTTTTTTTTTTAPIPDDALLSGLSAGSIVGTAGQPPSGSFHLPSSDESVLSQLPPLDFSDGGVDTPFDLSNALSAS